MATHTMREQLTLLELAKRSNNAVTVAIAEVLAETNEFIADAIWVEANQPTSHVTTRRVSLPSGTWRKINGGVSREASTSRQIVETMGLLEAYSVVDKFLVDIAPNPQQFRQNEDMAFIEGLSQTFADCMFRSESAAGIYGDMDTYPERFNGLPERNDAYSLANTHNGGDVSANDDTSIYIVQWGTRTVHLIYPKGSRTAGVTHTDLGECTVSASDSPQSSPSEYQAYRSHFKLNVGLVVRDDRCVQRICNIDSVAGETTSFSSTTSYIDNKLLTALNLLPFNGVGAVVYVNRSMKTQMDILAKDKTNFNYTNVSDAFGRVLTNFRGVPIHQVDGITDVESSLTS